MLNFSLSLLKLKRFKKQFWKHKERCQLKNKKLDLESVMASPRMDSEKEWISLWMDWDLKTFVYQLYNNNNGWNFHSDRETEIKLWQSSLV